MSVFGYWCEWRYNQLGTDQVAVLARKLPGSRYEHRVDLAYRALAKSPRELRDACVDDTDSHYGP